MDVELHEELLQQRVVRSGSTMQPRALSEAQEAGDLSPTKNTSPVTDLARNLGGLLTSGRGGTPRRRISWSSNEDTPDSLCNLRKSRLFLGGNMADSPQRPYQDDSPMFQDRLLRDVSVADNCLNTSGSRVLRRVRTLPHGSRPQLQDTFGKENIPRCQQQQQKVDEDRTSPSNLQTTQSFCPHLPTSSFTSCTSSAVWEKKERAPFSPLCEFGPSKSGYVSQDEQAASGNTFTAPTHPPPRRTISPLKSIANHQSISRLNSTGSSFGCSSSERSSVSASGADSDDIEDGFFDVFDMEALDSDASPSVNDHLPRDFYRLLRDPLTSDSSEGQDVVFHRQHSLGHQEDAAATQSIFHCTDSPRRPPIRRCLSMIEESPVARPFTSPRDKLLECVDRNNNFGNTIRRPEDTRKRLLQDEEDHTFKKPCEPAFITNHHEKNKHTQDTKRRKSVSYLTKSPSDSLVIPSPRNFVQRSHSETDAISKALQISSYNPNMIGDCSGSYQLPLVKGRHDDLKAISSATLSNLMNGMYKDTVSEYQIVDCRYPYEFEGGHIQGACNLYTKESILEHLINTQPEPSSSKKHKILVFHCEFSSERGPNLSRFLRNKDREANKDNYPSLFHPEIYLLEGGYRDFFKCHKELCVPQEYLPMLSKDHEKDLRKFRSKSKSWSGDTKSRMAVRPGLKL